MFEPARKQQSSSMEAERRLQALLANPAIRALEAEEIQKRDAEELASRNELIDQLEAAEARRADLERDRDELMRREADLQRQLIEISGRRTRIDHAITGVHAEHAAAYRALRDRGGERRVIEATVQVESGVYHVRQKLAALQEASKPRPEPRGPGDFYPPMVVDHKAVVSRDETAAVLKRAEEALAALRGLGRARIPPRQLAERVGALLAQSGVEVKPRPRWEGQDGSDLLSDPGWSGQAGPTIYPTEIPLYKLPSEASQIVAAGTGKKR